MQRIPGELQTREDCVHVLTGDGPGKTTSALGTAIRAIGHGYKVYMIMFVKGKSDCGEILLSKKIPISHLHSQEEKPSLIERNLRI